MGRKMKGTIAKVALSRVLEALEQELIHASDEEVMAAARELGMNPEARESAAFQGLKYPIKPQLTDFFELDAPRKLELGSDRVLEAVRSKDKETKPKFEIPEQNGKDEK